MPLQVRQIYRFGRFTLDATAKVLLRDGEPVRLSRKAAETLLALIEHPGQVLTKDELIGTIWQGRVVDEANLIQNIAVVRRTLGLSPGQAGYIETFPGRGYRMLGPIVAEEEEPHRPQTVATPDPHPPESKEPAPSAHASPAIPQSARPNGAKRRALMLGLAAMAAIVPAVWWFAKNPSETQRQLPFRRTAVARLGGKEFQPAISPDGSNIAFVLEREGGTPDRIWLRSGQAPPITIEREGWECLSPAWSPDGKSLAYLRFDGDKGQLVIASAATGKDERVVTGTFRTRYGLPNHHLDWSPDGKTLAFDDTTAPEQPFAISLLNLETGNRTQLTTPPSNALGDVEPRFSPDGGSVSFIRVFHRARQGLFTIELDNRKLRQLSRDGFQISGQDWLPDGKWIVMGSNRSGDFRLWRVRAGRPGPELMSDWTGTYGDAPLQLSVARRASVLVYSVLQEDFNIWRLNLQARENGPDRWTRIVNSSAQDVSPQYSPDRTQICFRSDRTGEEQLWISSADGSNPRQVTRGTLRPSVGRWAPNGKEIVFNDSKEQDLYITRLREDGSWQVMPFEVKGIHPVFSSDAKWIYAGYSGNIIRVPVEGGNATVVSKTKGLSFGLSADGNSLYFVREVTDSTLWQLSFATGKVSKVLDGLVPYCTSCWAAGPAGIFYLADKRSSVNGQAIYFHAYKGEPDKMIAEYPEPLLPLGSGPFSLSSDGKYLMCVRVDPSNADVIKIEPYR